METENSHDNMAYRVAKITKGLKALAKDLNIPIVVLAQINRANGEEQPRLLDLKDSGATEADADVVMLLHRPEFYGKCKDEEKGLIYVNVAKNRNGPVSMVTLGWKGEFAKPFEKVVYCT
ncbi:hypothetical protein CCP3SC5AM1_3140002 [Gammaproteobacteria bacterium]